MSKNHRKMSQKFTKDRDEESSREYRVKRHREDHKLMKNLERALRNKDYAKLVRSDEY